VLFLLRDRGLTLHDRVDAAFAAERIQMLAGPPQGRRANAICERMIGTLRCEPLGWLLIVNEHRLRFVLH
jgi:hypothetical protein